MRVRNTTVLIAAGEKGEAVTKMRQSERSTDSDNMLDSEFYFGPILSHSIRALILCLQYRLTSCHRLTPGAIFHMMTHNWVQHMKFLRCACISSFVGGAILPRTSLKTFAFSCRVHKHILASPSPSKFILNVFFCNRINRPPNHASVWWTGVTEYTHQPGYKSRATRPLDRPIGP